MDVFEKYYNEINNYALGKNVEMELTLQEFSDNYYRMDLSLVDYLQNYKDIIDSQSVVDSESIQLMSSDSSGSSSEAPDGWWFRIGDGSTLPEKPTYGSYSFSAIAPRGYFTRGKL